jgi:SAM-dependent methyltransferase
MCYLPPVQQPPSGAPVAVDPSGLPPLNLSTADNYYGSKAFDYDLGREDSEKWKAEYTALQDILKGSSGILLDLPCGTGRFFPIYRDCGLKVIAADKSTDMLHQAKARSDQLQLNAQIGVADIARGIPFQDKSVDVTVCSQFLKFLTEPELAAVMRELGRLTRSCILASLFTSDRPTFRGGKRNWVHRLASFNAAVEAAGFQLKASAPIEPAKGHHIWMCEAA